jgi:hypothetical protein
MAIPAWQLDFTAINTISGSCFYKSSLLLCRLFFLMKKGIVGEENEYEKVSLWLQKLNIIVKINLRVMI